MDRECACAVHAKETSEWKSMSEVVWLASLTSK